MRWQTQEIATAVDGTVDGSDVAIEAVTQDSREIDAATGPWLFVPILAERDGHDFIEAAAASGAVATFSSRALPAADITVIQVADTERALSDLGRAARSRLAGATVVGITGSVGKTSTKDMLASIFAHDRPTHANVRSFNNEIGVPLSLLGAADDAEAVIVEMGARGVGHIAQLCEVASPTVGIVTTVGQAHTSEFGSVEAVAEGKGELVESLPSAGDGGVAVLNADVELVSAMARRTTARVVTFGDAGQVRAANVSVDAQLVPSFELITPWGRADVTLGVNGEHLIPNALAAAAAALASDVPMTAVVDGLATLERSPMRMALAKTSTGASVIDDSYNANPLSVEGALRSLGSMAANRRIAVLGVMAELGDSSAADHQRMADLASSLNIEVIALDAAEYGPRAQHAATIDAALAQIGPLADGDVVLAKGSRVAGLERLAAQLLSD